MLALVDPTVMVATLVAPCESVTVRVNVPVPVTIASALFAPEVMVTPLPAVQAYDWMVRLHAAALPPPLKVTELLAV